MKTSIYAAIDIGSNSVELKVSEYNGQKLNTIEYVSKIIDIGYEVYTSNYIGEESTNNLINILIYYKSLMDSYGVSDYKAVATSAFRNAKNRDYVVQMIFRKTALKVDIIDDSLEKYITYKSIRDNVDDYQSYRLDGTVIVELTSGACDVSFISKNKLIRNDEIGLGSQVQRVMLSKMKANSINYHVSFEEYIKTKVDYMTNILKKRSIKHYIAIGGYINVIRDMFFESRNEIPKDEYLEMYSRAIDSDRSIIEKCVNCGNDWNRILPSVIFFKVFFDIFNTDKITITNISLIDGLIAEICDDNSDENRYFDFNEDPFYSSYQTAKRFKINTKHSKYVHNTSLSIISAIKNEFSIPESDVSILRHSSYLHEIGKSLNLNDYYRSSASMIKGLRLYGVDRKDVIRISNVCEIMGKLSDKDYDYYEYNKRDVRLAAILTISDAFDASKKQKILIKSVDLSDDNLIIKCSTKGVTTFEDIAIDYNKDIIKHVYGLNLIVKEVK